jgi:hypothetical protein
MQPYFNPIRRNIEDDLHFLENGFQPQFFGNWKTTSSIWKMEDDLNFFENGRKPQSFESGRQPKFF